MKKKLIQSFAIPSDGFFKLQQFESIMDELIAPVKQLSKYRVKMKNNSTEIKYGFNPQVKRMSCKQAMLNINMEIYVDKIKIGALGKKSALESMQISSLYGALWTAVKVDEIATFIVEVGDHSDGTSFTRAGIILFNDKKGRPKAFATIGSSAKTQASHIASVKKYIEEGHYPHQRNAFTKEEQLHLNKVILIEEL